MLSTYVYGHGCLPLGECYCMRLVSVVRGSKTSILKLYNRDSGVGELGACSPLPNFFPKQWTLTKRLKSLLTSSLQVTSQLPTPTSKSVPPSLCYMWTKYCRKWWPHYVLYNVVISPEVYYIGLIFANTQASHKPSVHTFYASSTIITVDNAL